MMPVIRISDDVFRRLQRLATPLVDTPASVIERLLDTQEGRTSQVTQVAVDEEVDTVATRNSAAKFETYENRANRHITIHRVGCSQLRKRGGVHRHGQGEYHAHDTMASAQSYAKQTGLPIKPCSYCSAR